MKNLWIRIQMCIIFCSCALLVQAQVVYERIFEEYTTGWDVKATKSGDYLLLCEKPALLKVNENGNIIWEKELDLSAWGRFLHVTYNQDIVIYTTNITLLDSTGSVKWIIDPEEEISQFSSFYFLKMFENSQDSSFLFISLDGDFLKIDRKGNILTYHQNTSTFNPWIKDVYRDSLNGYWQVGYVRTQIGPASHQISGAYVAKLDSCYTLEFDTVFVGIQAAVAVNQGLSDDIVVLVDSLGRSKILHLTEAGDISRSIHHLGNWNFINTNCRIEQIGTEEYLLFGHTVTKVNTSKVLDQSISSGEQIINSENVFYFISSVCPECDEYNPIFYAGFSKEVLGFPYFDQVVLSTSSEIQISPNPVISDIYLDISPQEYSFMIVDLKGNKISHGKDRTRKIDVSQIPEGIYVLMVKTKKELFYSKFIKISN